MSSDRSGSGGPEQRYSRFSQSTYRGISTPRPREEPSLTDLTARALNGVQESAQRPLAGDDAAHRQPPPPEPGLRWGEAERQAIQAPAPVSAPAPHRGWTGAEWQAAPAPAPAPGSAPAPLAGWTGAEWQAVPAPAPAPVSAPAPLAGWTGAEWQAAPVPAPAPAPVSAPAPRPARIEAERWRAPVPAAAPAPRQLHPQPHPHAELRPAFGREVPPQARAAAVPPQPRARIAQPATVRPPEALPRRLPERPAAEPVIEFTPGEPVPPGMMSRAVGTVRAKAGPALVSSAFWLAHNLRRREIRKRYNKALVFGHTRVADRKLEKLFFVPTLKSQTIDPAPDRGIHYDGPIPAAVFGWVMSMVTDDLRPFAFIDIRAGRGRTSLLASRRNFNRILAYEWDEPLYEDLRMNIAQYPRSLMACRNIDCYRGDIAGISLPDQPCVIYFSSAWREPLIPGVMNYVRQTFRQSPRRIYVIMENVAEETMLGCDDIFGRLEPGLAERLKLRLLSPMDFRVYRTTM